MDVDDTGAPAALAHKVPLPMDPHAAGKASAMHMPPNSAGGPAGAGMEAAAHAATPFQDQISPRAARARHLILGDTTSKAGAGQGAPATGSGSGSATAAAAATTTPAAAAAVTPAAAAPAATATPSSAAAAAVPSATPAAATSVIATPTSTSTTTTTTTPAAAVALSTDPLGVPDMQTTPRAGPGGMSTPDGLSVCLSIYFE